MATLFRYIPISCALGASLLFFGCDKPKPVSYLIPKESREAVVPMPVDTEKEAATASGMSVLPGMQAAADAAGDLKYASPAGWIELPASGIRKANFRIEDENGAAELTVTVFPGDVGGRLGNINRWRGQIGLEPSTPDDLPEFTESYSISKHRGLLVRLEGGKDSIFGGLLPFHGSTWFFKLQGSSMTVLGAEPAFREFLDSIEIPDTHH